MIPKVFFVILLAIAAPVIFGLLFLAMDHAGISDTDKTECYVVVEEHKTHYTIERCR